MKTCPRCKSNPITRTRADGRPVSYCDPCARAYNRRYDRRPTPESLNRLLRDMPGSRVPLVGIAEAA